MTMEYLKNYQSNKQKLGSIYTVAIYLDQLKFIQPIQLSLSTYDIFSKNADFIYRSIYSKILILQLFDQENEIKYMPNKTLQSLLSNNQRHSDLSQVYFVNVQINSPLIQCIENPYVIQVVYINKVVGQIFSNEFILKFNDLKSFIKEKQFIQEFHECQFTLNFCLKNGNVCRKDSFEQLRKALIERNIDTIKIEIVKISSLEVIRCQQKTISVDIVFPQSQKSIIVLKEQVQYKRLLLNWLYDLKLGINEKTDLLVKFEKKKADEIQLQHIQKQYDSLELLNDKVYGINLIENDKLTIKVGDQVLLTSLEKKIVQKMVDMEKKQDTLDNKLVNIENKLDQLLTLFKEGFSNHQYSQMNSSSQPRISVHQCSSYYPAPELQSPYVSFKQQESEALQFRQLESDTLQFRQQESDPISFRQLESEVSIYEECNKEPEDSLTQSFVNIPKQRSINLINRAKKSKFANPMKYKFAFIRKNIELSQDLQYLSIYLNSTGRDNIPQSFALLNYSIESLNEEEIQKGEKKKEFKFLYQDIKDKIKIKDMDKVILELITCQELMVVYEQQEINLQLQ